ncbi:glycosyltransferase [Rhodococcus sp. RDE2]|uniref:glycosyltransferase n=1 Tax=Rhodococcus sp. RDE2 TaxID=2885078 RepID=UPI001E5FC6C8|nr:glycosyltransferase [Rhodococcus sp. RDE2]BDB62242.1 glycosyltransferase WbuB [Rhodococcus sp. RDE2]
MSARKKLTIIGLNYAPEMTGIAPYTTKFCEHMQGLNYEVKVITGYPHYPSWSVSPEHQALPTRQEIGGVGLTRVKHYVPSPPSLLGRLRMELSFGLRAICSDWGNPDAVICISPSLVATGLVLLRAKMARKDLSVGVWVQDIYTRGMIETTNAPGTAAKILSALEARLLRTSDSVSVIHSRFKDYVTDVLGVDPKKVHVLRNWAHVGEAMSIDPVAARNKLGWAWKGTLVVHAGNMGAKQGLENVVEAARIAAERGLNLHFVLLGDGNQRQRLEESGLEIPNLHFIDPVSDELFPVALAAADILLVNEKPGVTEMAVPSKLTTYFSSDRPVVAATEQESTTAEEIHNSGGGVVVAPGKPHDLIEAAIALGADKVKAANLATRGKRYRDEVLSASACLAAYEKWVGEVLASKESKSSRSAR